MIPLLDPKKYWECPSCHFRQITHDPRPTTQLHACRSHNGVAIPLVQVHPDKGAPKLLHRIVERGDYVNGEQGLRYDANGRPIMAVQTERPDGSYDTHVFPGVAVMDIN